MGREGQRFFLKVKIVRVKKNERKRNGEIIKGNKTETGT